MDLYHHKTDGQLGTGKRVAFLLLYGRHYLHLELGRQAWHMLIRDPWDAVARLAKQVNWNGGIHS